MIELNKEYKDKLKGIKFIDLFCGLGGFRLALESFGAECVFSSDIDKNVSKTYFDNFNDNCLKDITKTEAVEMPSHNILCGGFPCQAFSIGGYKKGFDDERGVLFLDIIRIAKYHLPELLFLENVKGLVEHDEGKTFKIIVDCLEDLGYNVYTKVLNSKYFDVPQSRERIYFICIRQDIDNKTFEFPKETKINKTIKDILLSSDEIKENLFIDRERCHLNHKYTNNNLFDTEEKRLLVAGYNGIKDHNNNRIYYADGLFCTYTKSTGSTNNGGGIVLNNKVRRLQKREVMRLFGFPDSYKIDYSHYKICQQAGNSVVVNVIQSIIKNLIDTKAIKSYHKFNIK